MAACVTFCGAVLDGMSARLEAGEHCDTLRTNRTQGPQTDFHARPECKYCPCHRMISSYVPRESHSRSRHPLWQVCVMTWAGYFCEGGSMLESSDSAWACICLVLGCAATGWEIAWAHFDWQSKVM